MSISSYEGSGLHPFDLFVLMLFISNTNFELCQDDCMSFWVEP